MKPFCKETEFRALGSVWLPGGFAGSADSLWMRDWKKKGERYVHIRDGVYPLSSNGGRTAENMKVESALISLNLPKERRKGLQIIMDSLEKGNRPINSAKVGINLIFKAIYLIKANHICSLTLGNVNMQQGTLIMSCLMIFTLKMPILLRALEKTIPSPGADRSWVLHDAPASPKPRLRCKGQRVDSDQ